MATQKSDAEKMLQRYIYYRMKKKNLHKVAELFAKEVNLEIPEEANLKIPDAEEANMEIFEYTKNWVGRRREYNVSELESDDEPLTIFWESFWPTFVSTMSSEAGEAGTESSEKHAMETALAMLAGPNSQGATGSQQTPMGNAQQSVLPVVPQATRTNQQWAGNVAVSPDFSNRMRWPVTNLLPTPETSMRWAGKQPTNAESDYILRQSATGNLMAAQTSRNERFRFPSGQNTFVANTGPFQMPTSGNPSRVQLPAFAQPVVHVTRDPRNDFAFASSNQMDSTRLAVLDSAYPRAAYRNAGESGQMRLTGRGASDGLELFSSEARLSTRYLQFMQREVQARQLAANPPQYTFSQEVQVGGGTSRTENMRIETPGWGVTRWNDPNSAHASTLAGEKEAEGGNNIGRQTRRGRRNY